MQYDPIKRTLGRVFNRSTGLRKLFYRLLDLLLLRAWHMHRALRKAFSHIGHDRPSILDAGAGFGQYTYWMWKRLPASNIMAVDVKQEQVEDCNMFFSRLKADGVRFEVADLTAFERQEAFDLALSVDVMEHIEDDTGVFRNICLSLKPGGILLISTPSDQGGSDADDETDESFIGEHVRNGYNRQEIIDKLNQAGFSKVDARYTYGVPGNISWKLSMKYPILMLGASRWFFILLPFYYLIAFPIACILNWMDLSMNHEKGTGLLVKAWK